MHKIYLLLRDNKQTGPHTLDELIQLGLKPFDLIWAEGRTAGWQYPSEISALKPYLPQGKTPATDSRKMEAQVSASDSLNTNLLETAPRKKGAGDKHIYVSLPATASGGHTGSFQTADEEVPGEEKKESFEERVERMKQKMAAFAAGQMVEKQDDEVDTKYSRSLNDIKEEYAAWMYQQKKKKSRTFLSKKNILVASLGVFLLIAAFGLIRWMGSNDVASESGTLVLTEDANQQSDIGKASITEDPLPKISEAALPEAEPAILGAGTETRPVAETPIEDSYPEYAIEKTSIPVSKPVKKTTRKENNTVSSTENRENTMPSKTVTKEAVAKAPKKRVPLTQQIQIDGRALPSGGRKGFSGMEVSVQNNSAQLLKLVAVDVMYYNNNDKVLEKKTLYFNNIHPGNTLTITAPGHKRAVSAKYQMGLVTSEEGSIYFAKQ